ncbi:hypothetical protein ACQUD3_02215 [Lactococcus lactis]|uniref:hypothetical protein n=1 Tax=Lactococcus lactis TaxID=1358 RepID=UPI00288D05E7|nr:hypothetical protein [Lactococcus lactis]MDT2914142.1 hypothetical protein [Lactococcus lactis]MDT2944292.1 hypothetical protein [Lactococcus lactis]
MDNKRISEIIDEEMIKQDANRYRDMRKILMIPKSIADELDLINASEYENLIENFFESYNDSTLSERLDEFCIHPFNFNLCILYLVSIELGVDLVKVVEG